MEEILVYLEDLFMKKYEIELSDLDMSVHFGCGCGCGGDIYSAYPEQWDAMVEAEDEFKKQWALFTNLDLFTDDEIEELDKAFKYVDEKPYPGDECFTTTESGIYDFEEEFEYWVDISIEYTPVIANAMLKMVDVNLSLLEVHNETTA